MNTINNVGSQPVFVPAEGAAQTASTTATAAVTGTTVQETPSVASGSAQPSAAAPSLSPPASTVDYAGAKSTMSAYTALIILVCESNRESYAANRAMSKAQMHTRVAELKDVAAKRKTAAIVGLVMGVISGAVGVAGGASGIAGSAKNLETLHALKAPKAPSAGAADAAGGPKTGREAQSMNEPAKLAPAPEKALYESAAIDIGGSGSEAAGGADPRGNAAQALNNDITLRGVEIESAKLQSLSVLYGAFQSSLSTLGQSASGIVSSDADLMAAAAEATEGARQTSVSAMQQFQDLMGKFTQILSALLEAENKARSAAAQA